MLVFCKTFRILSDATAAGFEVWLVESLRGSQSSVGFTGYDEESMNSRPSLSGLRALCIVLSSFRSLSVDPVVVHVGLLEQFEYYLEGK